MKKQYLLGSAIVVLTLVFNTSIAFAQQTPSVVTEQAAVQGATIRTGFFSFLKNIFFGHKDSLPANVITSAQVSQTKTVTDEQKVNEQEIKQLEAKLKAIDTSIRAQTTVLENSVLNKLVPNRIVSQTTVGKAIEDKNKLLATLAEKSPKDAIAFIKKNKLVGKKQLVGTPVTKITKKDIVIDIGNYSGSYTDGPVKKTVFTDQLSGISGEYRIDQFSGYQFGDNIIIVQIDGFKRIGRGTHVTQFQEKSLCITPPPDMVSWWTGDTDSTDHFGPNNGHFQGGTTISAGYVDDSFLFDGVNDDIEVFNNPSLTPLTNEFTFDFWMKPTQVTAAPRTLIRKGKTYRITSDGRNINFEVENPTTSVRYISTTTVPLILNQWNFVAVSYSGPNQTMTIYVNGNEIPTTVNTLFTTGFPQTIIHQLNSLYFGADYGMSNYFQGNLDEIEFFDRVLTIAELQSIFDAGSAGKCKPILPDLIVTYFSWQPTNPTVGGYLVVQPTIKNIGTATADITSGTRFAVYKNSIDSSNFVGWLEVGTGAFSLAPGASTTLTSFDLLPNAVDQAGAFNFVINADDTIASMMPDYPPTTNHVIESNENNNSLIRFITIQ